MAIKEDQTLISLVTPKSWFKKNRGTTKETIPDQPTTTFKYIPFVKKYWLYFLILTILVFGVYLNSLGNDLVSDDRGLLIDKDNLTKLSYIFADPLSFIHSVMFAIATAIFGINGAVLRFLNVLFHLGNTYLIFIILSLMASYRLGFFTAVLFSVHPLLSEAVTWISGGPYAQYTFFFLLAFLLYILSQNRKKLYFASLFVFLIGLLTSNRIMTLFPILILYEFCFGHLTGGLKKNWKKLVPFVALSIFWGIVYMIQIGVRQNTLQTQYYLERGWDNPLIQIPFALANYFILFLYPQKLTFYHSDLTVSYAQIAIYWGIFLIYIGLLIFTFLKNRFLFFWLSFFLIGLAITLTPFRIAWIVAERYAYLSVLGLVVVVGYFLEKFFKVKKLKIIIVITFITIITALGLRTITRNTDWKNEKSLFLATTRTTPQSPKAHNNLGVIYTDEKNFDMAEKELLEAIKLKPNYGDAYYNYGYLKQLQNKLSASEKLYHQALELNPNLYAAYRNLGAIYFASGHTDLALENTQKAIGIQPKDSDLYTNLAIIYFKMENKTKAVDAATQALKVNPNDKKAQAIYQQLQK